MDSVQREVIIKLNDDLEKKTENYNYKGYIVNKIWRDITIGETKIRFQNNVEIFIFEGHELLTSYAKYMIEYLETKLS